MNDKRLLLIFKEIQQRLEKNEARADELAKREIVNGKDGRDGKDGVNGKDGKDGLNGRDGKDGKDGVDGKDGKNGLDGINGKDGLNGRDGKDGKNGEDGRGIKKLYVDKNGHLIVIYTDGKQEDLGRIVGKDGKTEVVVRNSGARTGKDGVSIVDVYIDERRHLICIMSDGQEIDAGYVGGGGGGGAVDDVTVNGTSVVESGIAVIDLTPYALANHNHDGIYALIDHNHDTEYAGINHNHDTDYAAINHNHDADYAAKNHNHDEAYAGKQHEHTVADITDMPNIPTKTSDLDNDSGFINQQALANYYNKNEVDTALQGKANANHTHEEYFEKTGGNISGNVDIDGDLILNIPDDDYDVTVTAHARLDENRGTIISFTGNASGTPYKTALENIGTPVNDYDAVNFKTLKNMVSITWITGVADNQGIVVSSDAYDKIFDAITTNKSCYLKLTTPDGVHVLRLKSWIDYNDHSTHGDSFLFVDAVNGHTTKTVVIDYNGATYAVNELEQTSNKVTAFSGASTDMQYPSAKLCEDMFSYIGGNYQRNPVLIYDKTEKLKVAGTINSGTDSADGLLNQGQGEGLNREITSWNIEGMDLSAFRYLRVLYVRKDNTASSSGEFNIPLDGEYTDNNIFVNGATTAAYANRNRLNCILCAVDKDKSKFCVAQTLSLYGTAATTISSLFVTKIYGCY